MSKNVYQRFPNRICPKYNLWVCNIETKIIEFLNESTNESSPIVIATIFNLDLVISNRHNVGNYLHRARSDRCLVRWHVAATPVCKPSLKIQKYLPVVSSRKVKNARLDNFFVPTVMHDSDQYQRQLLCRCRALLLPQIEKIFQPSPKIAE